MAVDYQSKWVRNGVTFSFTAPYTLTDGLNMGAPTFDIPSASPKAVDGDFGQDGTLEGRAVTFGGVLEADTPQQLRDRWDTLSAALVGRAPGQFYKDSDRYINGRIVSLQPSPADSYLRIEWTASLKCTDPLFYDPTPQSATLGTTTGNTAITPGGNWFAVPVFTFVFTSGGVLTVSGANGGQFILTATAGTYKVDCGAGTVQRNTGGGYVDAYDQFQSSDFFGEGIGPNADSISLVLSGGAALSSASVAWLKRFTGA